MFGSIDRYVKIWRTATELISFDPNSKKFIVQDDALAVLKKLTGPVAVISVCGKARMGKSTLLNQLLGKLSGGVQKGRIPQCITAMLCVMLM